MNELLVFCVKISGIISSSMSRGTKLLGPHSILRGSMSAVISSDKRYMLLQLSIIQPVM